MLKSKFKFLFLLVAIVVLFSSLSFATEAPAENSQPIVTSSETPTTTSNADTSATSDWINKDLFEIGDTVKVDKVVDGNVFIMAKEVVISSEIGGDVFVMAEKVTIEGAYIYCSLFAMAKEITINGIVSDAYLAADTITITSNGYVYRDLKATANTINLSGKIRRNAYLSANTYNFKPASEGDTLIGGNLNYTGDSELTLPEGLVLGNVNYEHAEETQTNTVGSKVTSYVFSALNNVIYILVVLVLTLWLAPKFVENLSNMSTGKIFASIGLGILSPIAITLLSLLLLFSVVGAKVAICSFFVFVAICMSGSAFASIFFGSKLSKAFKWEGKFKLTITSLISALLIWCIGNIPYVGGIISLVIASFGIGALILNIIRKKDKTATTEVK